MEWHEIHIQRVPAGAPCWPARTGALAQSGRAPPRQGGGRRFEPDRFHVSKPVKLRWQSAPLKMARLPVRRRPQARKKQPGPVELSAKLIALSRRRTSVRARPGLRGRSSIGRASVFQTDGCEFDPRRPLWAPGRSRPPPPAGRTRDAQRGRPRRPARRVQCGVAAGASWTRTIRGGLLAGSTGFWSPVTDAGSIPAPGARALLPQLARGRRLKPGDVWVRVPRRAPRRRSSVGRASTR